MHFSKEYQGNPVFFLPVWTHFALVHVFVLGFYAGAMHTHTDTLEKDNLTCRNTQCEVHTHAQTHPSPLTAVNTMIVFWLHLLQDGDKSFLLLLLTWLK